jgi:sugar lactone lactonase YvrE
MLTPGTSSRLAAFAVAVAASCGASAATPDAPQIERVTTMAPFPRGLAMVDETLYVLCRGRVRGAGGVTAEIDDQAGTIYAVDPRVAEPFDAGPVGDAVRSNGSILARPVAPPFRLWDRAAEPPERDRLTDRPYCTLRWHAPTHSFYICAFSGVDLPQSADDPVAFSKNHTDAVLRFDLRTRRWSEIERHRADAGWRYPHGAPPRTPPPHGLLKGPDNCLPLGSWLYAVAKDNSVLARYDLRSIERSPDAPAPAGEIVLRDTVSIRGAGDRQLLGQSGLAYHDGWLYVAYRTSSVIVRLRLDGSFDPVRPIEAEMIARFDPWEPATGHSADLTDLTIDERGRLYVVSAQPARVHRFTPDPDRVYDGRTGAAAPWIDLAERTGNPRMKSENILAADGWLYVTSGDGYGYQDGASGTVYRVAID